MFQCSDVLIHELVSVLDQRTPQDPPKKQTPKLFSCLKRGDKWRDIHEIMVASAIFIMDLKGKVIVSRNYRGDIPMNVAERYFCVVEIVLVYVCRFAMYIQERDEMELRPVFTDEGITFVYIKVA